MRSISSPSMILSSAGPVKILWQDALERGVGGLDSQHRIVYQLADYRLLGVRLEVRPARFFRHPEHILGEIFIRVFRR
jgi:hypothetical protein